MASDARAPSLLRSKLFWTVVGLPTAVVVSIGCLWYVKQSSLESRLEALRAQGLPTTASEINDFYAVPEGVAETTERWMAAIDAVQAANLDPRTKNVPFVGEGETPVPPPGEPWEDLDASRTLLNGLDAELQTIRRAAAADGQARFPVDFSAGINTVLPYAQNSRHVARLLVLDAHVSAHDGNHGRGHEDVKAIFALSDALRGEPCLISQLVRIAIHAMGCNAVERSLPYCEWSDAELASLQSAILPAEFREEMRVAFCGERAVCLSALDSMTLGPLRTANKQFALDVFEDSIQALSSSWSDAMDEQRELDDRVRRIKRGTFRGVHLIGVLLILPALDNAVTAGARAEARQRCANAALAAQRYRLMHGRLPESLEEIDPRLLGTSSDPLAQLTDPFNGKPLRYEVETTRVVIYSVGENGEDDGGDIDSNGDDGQQPLDFGFAWKR